MSAGQQLWRIPGASILCRSSEFWWLMTKNRSGKSSVPCCKMPPTSASRLAREWRRWQFSNKDSNFQLVLTDLMMPELDGVGLLEIVKVQHQELPVVMVTAVHDISVALAAIRNGAYDYLLKPFEREQLLAVVRRALEANRLRVENHIYQSEPGSLGGPAHQGTSRHHGRVGTLLRRDPGSLGGCARFERRRNRGPLQARNSLHHPNRARHGIEADVTHMLARGAFLHDIGKMAIPDAILRKPNPLNAEEIDRHAGAQLPRLRMLKKIPFLSRGRRDRLCPPGTLGRERIPAWAQRRGDSAGGANLRRCRHPGRHHLRPSLSRRAQRGSGAH